MLPLQSPPARSRKQRGDYPTPMWLVEELVERTLPSVSPGQTITIVDLACGDGRFLVAAAQRLRAAGARPVAIGVDIDANAVAAARRALAGFEADLRVADALDEPFDDAGVDVVLGNPPYLSPLAATTTRRGSSRHGGGPYADAAAEFLAMAVRITRPGGRIGLVLPQSVLASRDVAAVRAEADRRAELVWSWWSPRRVFDASVLVCAVVLDVRQVPLTAQPARAWSHVVLDAIGIPPAPSVTGAGTLADRARVSANFRDQYYGLVGAVGDDVDGPPLITSGLIDPGRCRWGERPMTFARHRLARPRVDLGQLTPPMRRWADELLVPKVLVANQTTVIEAVADPAGAWLPGVPVLTARPHDPLDVWSIATVLTSPLASAWAWQRAAGTGLSAGALRLGPRWLGELPWPRRSLTGAVDALRSGDVAQCGRAVMSAYGLSAASALGDWWQQNLPG